MKGLNDRARETINRLLAAYDTPGALVDTLARASLIPINSPCGKWSLSNRMLCAIAGTSDARGYNQWREVNRNVRKGEKALYILAPRFGKRRDPDAQPDDDGESVLIGFLAVPVFGFESTDGEALADCTPDRLPVLADVAAQMGVTVEYTGGAGAVAGTYRRDAHAITLYSAAVQVFYHELSHAAHHALGKIRGAIGDKKAARKNSEAVNEVVAELAAAVLVRIYEGEEIGRQALEYVRHYQPDQAKAAGLAAEVLEVVEYIRHLDATETTTAADAAA